MNITESLKARLKTMEIEPRNREKAGPCHQEELGKCPRVYGWAASLSAVAQQAS
jgi:hypothetical protein